MNAIDHDNKNMCRQLVHELSAIWGREKFNDWWQRNVVALRYVIYWDYKTLYAVLAAEYDDLLALQKEYSESIKRAQEWPEQAIDERP